MTLYLARHGETDSNRQRRFTGSMDVPLNSTGLAQAELLAEKLRDIPLDVVVSSNMRRAIQTAQVVATAKQLPLEIMAGFEERSTGDFEGRTREEAAQLCGGKDIMPYLRELDTSYWNIEPIRKAEQRVVEALALLMEQYPGQTVLLVCHGFIARVIYRVVNQIPYEEMHRYLLGNCEIEVYQNLERLGK